MGCEPAAVRSRMARRTLPRATRRWSSCEIQQPVPSGPRCDWTRIMFWIHTSTGAFASRQMTPAMPHMVLPRGRVLPSPRTGRLARTYAKVRVGQVVRSRSASRLAGCAASRHASLRFRMITLLATLPLVILTVLGRALLGTWLAPGVFFALYWSAGLILPILFSSGDPVEIGPVLWLEGAVLAVFVGGLMGGGSRAMPPAAGGARRLS